jgi:hypothetical protein
MSISLYSLFWTEFLPQFYISALVLLDLFLCFLSLFHLALLQQIQILPSAVIGLESMFVINDELSDGLVTLKGFMNLPSQYLMLSKLRYPQ